MRMTLLLTEKTERNIGFIDSTTTLPIGKSVLRFFATISEEDRSMIQGGATINISANPSDDHWIVGGASSTVSLALASSTRFEMGPVMIANVVGGGGAGGGAGGGGGSSSGSGSN